MKKYLLAAVAVCLIASFSVAGEKEKPAAKPAKAAAAKVKAKKEECGDEACCKDKKEKKDAKCEMKEAKETKQTEKK